MRVSRWILVLGLAPACSSSPGRVATVTDSAGVTIVMNGAVDQPLTWRVEPVATHGGADEGPEAFYQVRSGLVAVAPNDVIYVLDRSAYRVVRIRPDGTTDVFVEGHGEGPGELGRPVRLGVAPDGDVVVVDAERGRYVRFAPDGTLRSERMTESFDTFAPLADSGVIVVDQDYANEGFEQFLRYFPGPELARTGTARVTRYQLTGCGASPMFMSPVIFAPEIAWSGSSRVVAVNSEPGYVIDLFDGTRVNRSVRRDLEPIPGTAAAAEAWSRANPSRVRFGDGSECIHDPAEVVANREFADVVPIVSEIVAGPDGELWVRRTERDFAVMVTDVFHADGTYLGTLPGDFPAPLGFTRDGNMLYVSRDDLDVERLEIARVVRDGS